MVVERLNIEKIRFVGRWRGLQHVARYAWASDQVEGKTVLDAACGVGYGSAMLAIQGKAIRVAGIDLSSEAILEARKRYGHLGNVQFQIGTVEDLPFKDNIFDIYTSFETIEHVPDPNSLLREAVRVLKPDGVLLISTPNRTLTNPGSSFDGKPFNRFHLREWTMPEFDKLLREFFSSRGNAHSGSILPKLCAAIESPGQNLALVGI